MDPNIFQILKQTYVLRFKRVRLTLTHFFHIPPSLLMLAKTKKKNTEQILCSWIRNPFLTYTRNVLESSQKKPVIFLFPNKPSLVEFS